MRANLIQGQREYVENWKKSEIYRKRLSLNKHKELFIVVDGPPYANGPIHMGHALNKLLKDFVVRWKNISGYQTPILAGWDLHGLPIEHKLEKEERKFRELSSLEKRKKAREYAHSQVQLQLSQLEYLNLSFPLVPHYKTSDSEFSEQEYLLFQNLFEKGLIKREYKPVHWSWSSRTALAESELEYREIECKSIYFYWEIVSAEGRADLLGSRVILWTTTPYSLEANLGIGFNPNLKYLLVEHREKKYLMSKAFFSSSSRLFFSGGELEIIRELKNSEFYSLKYWNNVSQESSSFLAADFVQEGVGTGFVHLAPGLGEEDYLVSRESQLEIYSPIDEEGYFTESVKFPKIAKLFYQDASEIVIEYLESCNSLLAVENIMHEVGHDWRTGKPILFRATKQFFVDFSELKQSWSEIFGYQREGEIGIMCGDGCFSKPEWLIDKLAEIISERKEWCISRQRAWGLPIPIIFKDGELYGGVEQLKRNIELILKHRKGVDSWFTEPVSFFLKDVPEEELSKFSKCTDILDVWFDSGSAFLLYEKKFGRKGKNKLLFLEGGDQLRGWFNSSSILSIVYCGSLPFTHIASHGFVLDKARNKMSKSKGNVVDPVHLISEVGADVFRFWVSSVNFEKDISFDREKLFLAQQEYRKFRNILFRFSLSVLGEIKWEEIELKKLNLKYPESRYIYLRFLELLDSSVQTFESLNFHKIISSFKDFIELWSTWYLELVKPYLYSRVSSDAYKQESLVIISLVFKYSLLFLSPFLPQTTESVYRFLSFPEKKEALWLEDLNTASLKNLLNSYSTEEKRYRWDFYFKLWESLKQLDVQRDYLVLIPSSKFEYFEEDDWVRLLKNNECRVIESEDYSIKENARTRCSRCSLAVDLGRLSEKKFENVGYLVCGECALALDEYWEKNQGREAIQ